MARWVALLAVAALCPGCPGKSPADAGNGGGVGGGTGAGGGSAGGGTGGGSVGGGAGGDAGPADSGFDAGIDAGIDAGAVHLSLAFHRSDAGMPSPILAEVRAVDDFGQPVSGLQIVIDAQSFSSPTTETAGTYRATIMPAILSGELPMVARLASSDAGVARTALVVPQLAAYWDQPEMLPGLVDTAGTEDSSTISPDGQWLILATYSPVDLLCCFSGCGGYESLDGQSPWCDTPLGPIGGPARPNMPGAERVHGTTIDDAVPLMCAASPDGGPVEVPGLDGGAHPFALPPLGIYMFHRQPDGTFAEPHVIDTGSDGFLSQPFCFTFLGTGDAGTQVPVLFGYNLDSPDGGKPHPWFAQLNLGEDNSLYSYSCPAQATVPTFAPKAIVPIPVGPNGQQAGNTTAAEVNGTIYLLSDDESASPAFVEYSIALSDGGYTDWKPMALPDPTADRRQPLLAGNRLFYYRNGDVVSTGWTGNDPSDPNSFSAVNVELGIGSPNGTNGELVGIGQPTLAAPPDAGIELYFVYYRRTATGLDGQIGRVPLR